MDERDYLKEAFDIHEGKTMMIPQLEHINALVYKLLAAQESAEEYIYDD